VHFINLPEFKIIGKQNVSETGSVSVFRSEEINACPAGSLRKS
jgi:hypothetical protein